MTTWGTVTMTKNPVEQVWAFVAHYLGLGAERVDLFVDNPTDPAVAAFAGFDRVHVTVCNDAFWAALGKGRPDRHQERQRRILRKAYRATAFDWLLNVDVDEFLIAGRPIPEILAAAPARDPVVQAAPYEALYDPDLPDDIFTARQFRAEITDSDLAVQVFGELAPMLTAGMLSHRRGKPFFRAGIAGLIPEIHHAEIGEQSSLDLPFHPDLALLHFHADNPGDWVTAAPYRAAKGAYRFRKALQAHLLSLGEDGLYTFHRQVHQMPPDKIALLRDAGLLVETVLDLRAKVAALRGR